LSDRALSQLPSDISAFLFCPQEIAKKELDGLQKQSSVLDGELAEAAKRAEHLQKLYDEQDELLKEIFGGEYGSDDENRLEAELDQVILLHQTTISTLLFS